MLIKEKLKKFGVPLLAGFVIFGSAAGFVGSKTFAASQQTAQTAQSTQTEQATQTAQSTQTAKQEVKEETSGFKASIFVGQQDNGKDESKDESVEAANDAALASKTKISQDEAVNAAKAAYPENTVQGAKIGDENGYLIYEVKMTDKAGTAIEVKVDAGNAKILATDNGSEEGSAEKNDKNEMEND